ncbi:MAG: GNAT family N-acetyltransferase [Bryobacterales bacterium]|nr:GNAT family N-acetyltransferase [Bryobacterales bacterium]
MRRASLDDLPLLLDLMSEFYAESGYRLHREIAEGAFRAVIDNAALGSVWIIEAAEQAVGHLVLTYRIAMEYGGLTACVDDLYVRPAWRNGGLATRALGDIVELCSRTGLRGMTVEVDPTNGPAKTAYHRVGFVQLAGREVLGMTFAPPAHHPKA